MLKVAVTGICLYYMIAIGKPSSSGILTETRAWFAI